MIQLLEWFILSRFHCNRFKTGDENSTLLFHRLKKNWSHCFFILFTLLLISEKYYWLYHQQRIVSTIEHEITWKHYRRRKKSIYNSKSWETRKSVSTMKSVIKVETVEQVSFSLLKVIVLWWAGVTVCLCYHCVHLLDFQVKKITSRKCKLKF